MLTFENVLEVFEDYMKEDADLEVISTKRGYTTLLWDSLTEDWSGICLCKTPEELFDRLLGHYQTYLGAPLVKTHGSLTPEDYAHIEELCRPFLDKRGCLE